MIGRYLTVGILVGAFLVGTWAGRTITRAGDTSRVIAAQEQTRATAERASNLLEIARGETEQCRAELTAINAANAELSSELNRVIEEDRQKSAQTLAAIKRAAEAAAASGERLEQRAEHVRAVIETVSDACVSAGVPADVVGMLNTIDPTTTGDGGDDP